MLVEGLQSKNRSEEKLHIRKLNDVKRCYFALFLVTFFDGLSTISSYHIALIMAKVAASGMANNHEKYHMENFFQRLPQSIQLLVFVNCLTLILPHRIL